MEFDERANPVVMRGVARDDTDSRLSADHFHTLLEAAPSAILLVDDAGQIRLLNAEAERTFGYAREELLGREVERLLPGVLGSHGAPPHHGQALSPDSPGAGNGSDMQGVRQDGSTFPIEVRLNQVRSGAKVFVLAAVTDVSERRRKEAELSQQREEVAHLSRVTMLGELSGSLAHELNQPLAAILSNAQAAQRMLLRNPDDLSEIRDILSDIVENDRRAGEVIRRLRALLRKGTQELCAVDVNETIAESLRLLRNDLSNRGIVVMHDLSPGLPSVTGDQVQLQQVLLNLVFNACDAMAGSENRRLAVYSAAADSRVRITVADSGPGIPPAMLERIFEPFHTTKTNGLGLGLAICRTIVESHHGRLWAQNGAGGRGAHFHIELPFERAGAGALPF